MSYIEDMERTRSLSLFRDARYYSDINYTHVEDSALGVRRIICQQHPRATRLFMSHSWHVSHIEDRISLIPHVHPCTCEVAV